MADDDMDRDIRPPTEDITDVRSVILAPELEAVATRTRSKHKRR
jgi:hypothetical protein